MNCYATVSALLIAATPEPLGYYRLTWRGRSLRDSDGQMSATELLSHPAFQLWAAATVPFACRFAAAWTVWLRVRGLWSPVVGNPRDRIPSGRSRSTTDPIVAGISWVIATLAATVVVVLSGPASTSSGPRCRSRHCFSRSVLQRPSCGYSDASTPTTLPGASSGQRARSQIVPTSDKPFPCIATRPCQ